MADSKDELKYMIDKEIDPFGKPLEILIPDQYTKQ